MPTRRIDAYSVLLAGYLAGAAIYVGGIIGVFAILASARGLWPWQVGWTWAALIYAAWPCLIQLLPFALFGAAVFGVQYLNGDRVIKAVALFFAVAVAGLNFVMFADWFVTEIVNANELRAFLRVRQGAIVDRFDGGMAVIAAYAIAKTMLLSLALAFALIAIAMVHQFVRRTQCARMRSQA